MRENIFKELFMAIPRGVNYHLHTSFSIGMKPTCLELMVTSKCNARCLMCNIWQSNANHDLKINEFEPIFSSPVLSDVKWVTITGGEPFLNKDLLDIIKLIDLKLKKVQEILISTNGLLTNNIVNQTKKALEILSNGIRLRIGISFDGVGEKHDHIRNIKGIHNLAVETVKCLQKIEDKRLHKQAHIAVGPYNIDQLEEMLYYYRDLISKINWFPVIIADNYYKNQNKADRLCFNAKTKEILKDFLKRLVKEEPPSPSTYYYYNLINLLETGCRNFPCTGGYRYMQIDSEGNVYPCPFVTRDFSFGNVRQQSLEKIWLSKKSNFIRKNLEESNACEKCSSHCDLFSVVREEFFDFMTFLMSHPKITIKMLGRYFHKINGRT